MTGRDVLGTESSSALPRFETPQESLPRFSLPDESSDSDLARTVEVRRPRNPDVCAATPAARVSVDDIIEELRAAAAGRTPAQARPAEQGPAPAYEDEQPAGVPRPWSWHLNVLPRRRPSLPTIVPSRSSHPLVPIAAAAVAFLVTLLAAYLLRGPLEGAFGAVLSQ